MTRRWREKDSNPRSPARETTLRDCLLIEEVRFALDSPLEGTGFEPSVPLLRKALLGVANRRRRHEGRSHLQVQVRNGNACLSGCPQPFPLRRDREFES